MKSLTRLFYLMIAAFFVAGMATYALAESWDMPTPYPDKTFHTVNIIQFADDDRK